MGMETDESESELLEPSELQPPARVRGVSRDFVRSRDGEESDAATVDAPVAASHVHGHVSAHGTDTAAADAPVAGLQAGKEWSEGAVGRAEVAAHGAQRRAREIEVPGAEAIRTVTLPSRRSPPPRNPSYAGEGGGGVLSSRGEGGGGATGIDVNVVLVTDGGRAQSGGQRRGGDGVKC